MLYNRSYINYVESASDSPSGQFYDHCRMRDPYRPIVHKYICFHLNIEIKEHLTNQMLLMESGDVILSRAVGSVVPARKGSEADAPPLADEARQRGLAKRTMRTAVSSVMIEPDGKRTRCISVAQTGSRFSSCKELS